MGKLPHFSLLMLPILIFDVCYHPAHYVLCFIIWKFEAGSLPALHRPSWRTSLEYINWCRRPFSTVSYYQALTSRWKGEIFEPAYIITAMLSESLKIPKTFTGRNCSPKFYVTIMKRKQWIKELCVYISIEICVLSTLAGLEFLKWNLFFPHTFSCVAIDKLIFF